MNQNQDMLENVHFGPNQPNCPAHFCPFAPQKRAKGFFSEKSILTTFYPLLPFNLCKKSEKINDSISFKVQKTPFWALLDQKRPKGIFSEKSILTTFYPLLSLLSFFSKIGLRHFLASMVINFREWRNSIFRVHKLSRIIRVLAISRTQTFANRP